MSLGWRRALWLATLGALAVVVSVALAACGSDDNNSSSSSASTTPASTTEAPAANAAKCGAGNGQKATGDADQASARS